MTRLSSATLLVATIMLGCRAPGDLSRPALTPATVVAASPTIRVAQATEPLPPPPLRTQQQPESATPEPLAPTPFRTVLQEMSLPPIVHELDGQPEADVRPLTLGEVTESVFVAYPGLEAAMRELEIAAGREQASRGEFDIKLKAASQSDPLGFYNTYKNAVKLEQPLWHGGGVYGQYRIGRGNFPTWDGLETNEGGEFKVGFLRPLLQNSAIDQRRADLYQATLRRQQVDPAVQSLLLQLVRDAAETYWTWVAAGQAYDVQRELLRVTIERNKVYEGRVEVGDLPRVELVQNQRLIAAREAKMVEAERKLQQSAIKLSLFLRDERGQPVVPSPASLPREFPVPTSPDSSQTDAAIAMSLANRPELRELELIRQQAEVDLAQGQNLRLPDLTATMDAAKDVGAATPKNDKTPFQLQAGLYFDVPLERNKAQGKIREARGKLAQIAAKRRLVENKIVIEVQDAVSAWTTSYSRYLRARENTQLAEQLVIAERQRFESQDSDLLRVAIQEVAAIEAALAEIDALTDFYKAEAAYRAATAQGTDR